jgi:hypothetical protein
MKLKWITVILGLSVAPSFSSAQNQQNSALNAARDEWHACIQKEVIKLDDHISPASDIATAVQMSCIREHEAMLDRMTNTPQMRDKFAQARADITKQVAVTMVLKLRARDK